MADDAPDYAGQIAALQLGLEVQWVMFGAVLVFLMQAGFTLLEVGSVSKKNTLNILTKNIVDATLGAAVWYAWGNVFAVSPGNDFIGFHNGYFLKDKRSIDNWTSTDNEGDDVFSGSFYANWTFAWAFAATAATIVSGAVAERCTFVAYMCYSAVLTGFVYPVVVHWAWGGGGFSEFDSLNGGGVIDFAGSGVVHMVGGMAALIGAAILGPRKNRFDAQTGMPNKMPAQSAVFQVLGTFILWVGWYGFNCVSTFNLTDGASIPGPADVAGKVSVTTTLSAAFGGLGCFALSKIFDGVIDPGTICNGILGGLVGITAGCASVEPEGAMFIGLISSLVYFGSSKMLLKLKVDDVVNAAPVHYFCGAWGVIAVGLFGSQNSNSVSYGGGADASCGVFYGCNLGDDQLAVQIAFVIAITVWVGGMSAIVFGLLKVAGVLRVPADVEEAGLDESEHGGSGEPKPSVEMAATNNAEQTV